MPSTGQCLMISCRWCRSGVFNIEHISLVVVVFLFQFLAQWRCVNVVVDIVTTLRHGREWVAPTSIYNVVTTSLSRVAKTLPQSYYKRCHNIKHWISRPFYYALSWFLTRHWNVRVTKVLSGIKHTSCLSKGRCIYI